MADVIGVYCLVWVYTHKFTQTFLCFNIVFAISQKGLWMLNLHQGYRLLFVFHPTPMS